MPIPPGDELFRFTLLVANPAEGKSTVVADCETPDGWRLAFDPSDMVTSQTHVNGDHWADWLATDCPALLVRGDDSRLTAAEHLGEMATRRANTRLLTLHGGHVIHADDSVAFGDAVAAFLGSLAPEKP